MTSGPAREASRAFLVSLVVVLAVSAPFVAAVPTTGDTAQSGTPTPPGDAPLRSGATVWAGQELGFDASPVLPTNPDPDDRTFRVREATDGGTGSLVDTITVDDDGTATVDTGGFDGDYVLTDGEGVLAVDDAGHVVPTTNATVAEASWEVEPQTLSIAADDATVRTGETVALEIDSNRADYRLDVSAGDRDAADLRSAFDRPGNEIVYVDETDDVIGLRSSTNTELNASFAEPGQYDLDVAVADATANDSLEIDVNESDVTLGFAGDRVVRDHAGDVVNVSVTLEGTDRAWVVLGSEDANLLERIGVEDANEDGAVNLSVDTMAVGDGSADGYAVGKDDELLEVTQFSGEAAPNYQVIGGLDVTPGDDGAIAPAGYRLRLAGAPGVEPDDGGLTVVDYRDEGLLHLERPGAGSIRTLAAPGDAADIDRPGDVIDNATARDRIAVSDRLVVEVDAPGVHGTITGGEPTTLYERGLELRIRERDPPSNDEATELDLRGPAVTLEPRPGADRFYVVVDPAGVETVDGTPLVTGTEYAVTFTRYGGGDDRPEFPANRSDAYPHVPDDANTSARAVVAIEDTTAEFVDLQPTTGDADYAVTPGRNVLFLGETPLAPGSTVTVRLASTGEFTMLRERRATVTDDGYFVGGFDLRDVPIGTRFEASVQHDRRELVTATIGMTSPTPTPTATETARTTPTSTSDSTETPTTTDVPATSDTARERNVTDAPTRAPTSTDTSGQPGFTVAFGAVTGAALLGWKLARRRTA